MKKNGFTLAELLVTLGIVGVIAALTIPTLLTDTEAAKIGPKLGKAVAVFEQANVALLADECVDSIYDIYGENNKLDYEEYLNALTRYMKVRKDSDISLVSNKDGIQYKINPAGSCELKDYGYVDKPVSSSNQRIVENFYISFDNKHRFGFELYNDGTLSPFGVLGPGFRGYIGNAKWQDLCPKDGKASDYEYCAGHIFENNMKVLYK